MAMASAGVASRISISKTIGAKREEGAPRLVPSCVIALRLHRFIAAALGSALLAGAWAARVGVTGVSGHHREGDGSTPAGLYGIGSVMYGIAANPGVRYAYHRLSCGDWWDEDPASPTYNTFQHVACNVAPPFKG